MFSEILACTGSRFDRLVVVLSLNAPAAGLVVYKQKLSSWVTLCWMWMARSVNRVTLERNLNLRLG